MKLSIGMIVKNEEKYLEQCLTALQPILQNVDSELIIADTGSTDRTVEIAKKFTENVFYFEWINDFAAARNSTLEKAKGEWFLYVDADEIFRSCDEIIKFFNSGEYKKFNSASYMMFNHVSAESSSGLTHDNFYVVRMSKILPESKFVGIVHELINTAGGNIRKLDDIADHYGYMFVDPDIAEKKFKRNSELLLKKFETEKNDPMLYMQLFDTYRMGDQNDEAIKYLEMGIEWCKEHEYSFVLTMYSASAFFYYQTQQFEKALEVCEKYFSEKTLYNKKKMTTDAEMLAIKGHSLHMLSRFDESIDTYKEFFDVFKDVQSGKLLTKDLYYTTYKVATDANFVHMLRVFVSSCINADRYNLADTFLLSMPINKYSFDEDDINCLIDEELTVLKHFEYKNLVKYMQRFDQKGQTYFKKRIFHNFNLADDKLEMVSLLSELGRTDDSFKEKADIFKRYYSGKDVSADEIYAFAKNYPVNEHFDIFLIAMDKGYDISPMFGSENFDMAQCVFDCYHELYEFPKAVEKYPIDNIANIGDICKVTTFFEYCMKSTIGYQSPKPKTVVFLLPDTILEKYTYLGERYKKENNVVNEDEMPEIMKAACMIGEIIDLRNQKKYKDCIALIRQVISLHIGVAAVMSEYSKSVIQEYENIIKAEQGNMSEMERLAVMVKNNIRSFITSGNYAAATKTLIEYKQLNPNDPEIDELTELIGKEG